MYKLGTCQYAVLVPLCKEAFANKEFTTTTYATYRLCIVRHISSRIGLRLGGGGGKKRQM